ncbi:glycoside hydrolase family 16 protein [Leifsonia sp. YIM 134122]|uniref:Glycoside hydrolase family 16 protein n=1 Tax=Leifsonia stereocauli TaxID=3134136 RepID=A0ABU9WAI7_9MICO
MTTPGESFPKPPTRAPDVHDDFSSPTLRSDLWVPDYLPHWTTPERSRARYEMTGASGLRLLIEHDQLDWREEDAPLRVSNLQTGVFSGPVGSERGTHRHRPDGLQVRAETPERMLWAPASGHIDITVSASLNDGCMLAAWLVGAENLSPQHSGEICIFEIDATAIDPHETRVRCGVKAHGDDSLVTDMVEVNVPVDASRPHTWSVIWGPKGTLIGCEGVVVKRSAQAPDYPMLLMLDLFEVGPRSTAEGVYPKSAFIHSVRGWGGPVQ